MALSCFLPPPGICLTSEIIHCHQLREYYFIRIFCSIFYYYLESHIIHLVYKYYTALSVNHMMTSPFIIEKFERVFQKYHYMSYSYSACLQALLSAGQTRKFNHWINCLNLWPQWSVTGFTQKRRPFLKKPKYYQST